MDTKQFNQVVKACLVIRSLVTGASDTREYVAMAFDQLELPKHLSPKTFSVMTYKGNADICVDLPVLNKLEVSLGTQQCKLEAVKAYKERTKCSLLEAKHAVEQWFTVNGLQFNLTK